MVVDHGRRQIRHDFGGGGGRGLTLFESFPSIMSMMVGFRYVFEGRFWEDARIMSARVGVRHGRHIDVFVKSPGERVREIGCNKCKYFTRNIGKRFSLIGVFCCGRRLSFSMQYLIPPFDSNATLS